MRWTVEDTQLRSRSKVIQRLRKYRPGKMLFKTSTSTCLFFSHDESRSRHPKSTAVWLPQSDPKRIVLSPASRSLSFWPFSHLMKRQQLTFEVHELVVGSVGLSQSRVLWDGFPADLRMSCTSVLWTRCWFFCSTNQSPRDESHWSWLPWVGWCANLQTNPSGHWRWGRVKFIWIFSWYSQETIHWARSRYTDIEIIGSTGKM